MTKEKRTPLGACDHEDDDLEMGVIVIIVVIVLVVK